MRWPIPRTTALGPQFDYKIRSLREAAVGSGTAQLLMPAGLHGKRSISWRSGVRWFPRTSPSPTAARTRALRLETANMTLICR